MLSEFRGIFLFSAVMDEKLIGPPEPWRVQKNDTWKKDRKNF